MTRGSLPAMFLLGAGILVILVWSGAALSETSNRYKPEECVRCHAGQVHDLVATGGNHKSVPCADCHAGHPPDVAKPIALCSNCHVRSKNVHFETPGCPTCHTNAHTPLKMSFKGVRTEACLPCHGLQGWMLRTYASKHSALDCSNCHDVHRQFPSCTRCHTPHKGKIADGCNLCHKAHMPKLAALPDPAPSKDCGMCHKIVVDLLRASTAKHHSLPCSRCHQQKHGMIPACEGCHGTPHPKDIMEKFPTCGWCHNIAHDVNWTAADNAETAEQAAEKQR